MNLLILEDEPILLDKYEEYAESEFDNIKKASSLKIAYELINENEFDVALIDYNLPDGNGLDLVKNYPQGADAPVFILITAYSKEFVAIDSLNAGVFKYLEKPFSKEQLLNLLFFCKNEALKRSCFNFLSKKFTILESTKNVLSNKYQISQREMEVIESILVHGKNKIVASKLFISQGTVRNHLSHIFQKLHISTKEELGKIVEDINSRDSK